MDKLVKLAALEKDELACRFLETVLQSKRENVFCRFLKENDKVLQDEIAVFSWQGSCPGKYFRTACHVLRGRTDSHLAGAKAFLGIKKDPPPRAVKEVLADMKYWPRLKKSKSNSSQNQKKGRSVYFGAW